MISTQLIKNGGWHLVFKNPIDIKKLIHTSSKFIFSIYKYRKYKREKILIKRLFDRDIEYKTVVDKSSQII